MRALLTPLVSLLLLLAPLAAAEADEAELLVGSWEFQDGSGEIDVRTFGPDKSYMQETRTGSDITLSISGAYVLEDDNILVTVESAEPQSAEIGGTLSLGLISVDSHSLVLNAEGAEQTGTRMSPAPAE